LWVWEKRCVFQRADEALGFSLSTLCFEGPEETLRLTEHTQPAILTVSVAALQLLDERGIRAPYVAGHSLGEYSALVAAGAIAFEEAVKLVRNRGRYMQEAVAVGEGAMAAIIGLSPEDVEQVCIQCRGEEVLSPANFNSPGQIVIAGHTEAVQRAVQEAREQGAKKAIPLPVSAPFHCALMEPAAEKLRADLDRAEVRDLNMCLVTNVDAKEIHTAGEARDALYRQVASPVRWQQSVENMIRLGVEHFVEIGPGRVLSGLIRRISRAVRVSHVEDDRSWEKFLKSEEA
jgi:[acyl-carrier-protein] S-malonyltransferase